MNTKHVLICCGGAGHEGGLDEEEHGYPDHLKRRPDAEEEGVCVRIYVGAHIRAQDVAFLGAIRSDLEKVCSNAGQRREPPEIWVTYVAHGLTIVQEPIKHRDARRQGDEIEKEVSVVVDSNTVVNPRTMAIVLLAC